MNKPQIQSDDRGITLNKPLAWTMLVTLMTGAFWVGVQVTSLTAAVDGLTDSLENARDERASFENRLRTLENRNARDEQRYSDTLRILSRIDTRMERLERALTEGTGDRQ